MTEHLISNGNGTKTINKSSAANTKRGARCYRYDPVTGEIWSASNRPKGALEETPNEIRVWQKNETCTNIYRRKVNGVWEFQSFSHREAARLKVKGIEWELIIRLSPAKAVYIVQVEDSNGTTIICDHVHYKKGGAIMCSAKLSEEFNRDPEVIEVVV
jgi:hypothetical protein